MSEYHPSELTARSRVLQNLRVSHLVKKFPIHHGTRIFTTAFTRTRRLYLHRGRSSSTPSQSISLRSTAILPPHSRLGLPCGPSLSGLPIKPRIPSPHTCHMPRPSHRPNNFWRRTNHEYPNCAIFYILSLPPSQAHLRAHQRYNLTAVSHLNTEYSDQPFPRSRVHKTCKY